MDKEDDYECIDYGDNPPQLPKPLKMADIMGILPRKLDPGQLNISPVLPQRYSHVPSNGEKKFQPPSPVATRSQPPPVAAKSQPPPIPVKPPSKQKKVSSSGQSTPGSTKANYENYCKTFNQQKIYESAFPIRPPSPRPPLPVPTSPETKSDTLMLADFVKRHSKNLPMRVMVEEGFCGSEEKFVVSAGDVYDFHFLKNEKEVSIRDCGGMHFSIPLNSDIEFGLLYNPSNNFSEALKGHVFKSVLEFVSCKSYPRLVQVVTAQSNNKTPLEVNELLVIKKVGKSMLRKPFMKVYSITAKEEKTLQDDCVATFTTDPQRIKLHLPEILDAFPDSFPLDAMMFAPEGDADDFPPHLTTDMVTLTHTSILSSIIATTHWDDDGN